MHPEQLPLIVARDLHMQVENVGHGWRYEALFG